MFPGNLLVFRFSVPALRLLPGGGRRWVDAAKLLGRVFAIDVPDVFQKRDDVRFLFQTSIRTETTSIGCFAYIGLFFASFFSLKCVF